MRVLLVTSRYPRPAWRGNQVRTVEWLGALADAAPGLVCPRGEAGAPGVDDLAAVVETYPLGPGARALAMLRALVGGRPLQEGLFDLALARAGVRRALEAGPWDVVVVQMVRCAWAVDEIERAGSGPRAVLFDAIDAMGLHFAAAAPGFSPLVHPGLAVEAARCRRREEQLVRRAAITTAVARRDLDALAVPEARARLVPVAAAPVEEGACGDEVPTVLLSGNLGYRPTVAAARFFADRVWPSVAAAVPGARWVLAGARPSPAIRALASRPGVEVHGDVPDLAPFLARATVAVAPMAAGSGVPMKVLEAWAAGVPVIAHPRAAEGLELGGEPAVAVAEGEEAWVREVVSVLETPTRAAELAAAGRRAWRRSYHPDRVREAIRAAVSAAAEARSE